MNLHETSQLLPLLEACLKGKRRAHNQLYQVAYPYAMSVALRYGANQADSAEIVNEAFFKAFSYLKNFDPSQSFAAWLRRIVINTAIDHFRARTKELSLTEPVGEDTRLEPETDELLEAIDAEALLYEIQKLPPTYRMVFSLFAIEGYSHREIAQHLGISEGTSKSNYHKAKAKLKHQLRQLGLAPKKKAL